MENFRIICKETKQLIRVLALEQARAYCEKHKLSFPLLEKQRFDVILDSAIFSQPSAARPNGLANDMDTMPLPTLIIQFDGEKVTVSSTEHTDKYLRHTA